MAQFRNPAGPLNVPNRAQAAAQALRDAILLGQLKPGDRIIENHWAATLGIGQPTVREALRELEYQGMLVKHPNRGTHVARLGREDYQQLMAVRMPLEVMAIRLAARNLSTERLAELQVLVDEMAAAVERRDLASFHERDAAFHRRIWDEAGNPYLAMCLESVAFRLFVFSVLGDRARLHEENLASVEQHRQILAGLRSRDPEIAERLFVESTIGYWNQYYGVGGDQAQPDPDSR
jgi:DNA-binding GntR family transcriptional regulator